MKIVLAGRYPESARDRIRGIFPPEWEVVFAAPAELAEALGNAEVLVPEHAPVDAALLDRAPMLQLVQTGAGYDNVDLEECARRGVRVACAAGVNAAAVAEHVLALVLGWYRKLPLLDRALKRGEWEVAYEGGELAGRTLGIVGLGRTGREVARLAAAFRMEVIGCARRAPGGAAPVQRVDLPALLRRSEVVSLHVPLTPETRHLIGREELSRMRGDAFLVNTSRGAVVDEAALAEALAAGTIAGAGLDVFEAEPLPADSPLRALDNVILTPHTAGMPDGPKFHRRRYEFFRENIARVLRGEPPLNALNRP